MAYAKQLSPGVQVKEIDLTNFVPTVGTSGGAFVGQFDWGPVRKYTIINDVNTLTKIFGKPTDYNYVDWFCAANFLAYNDNLKIVRVVDTNNLTTALNSTVDGSGVRIDNEDHYQSVASSGGGSTEIFVARYPGVLGDTLKVSMCDGTTYSTWKYKDEFDFAPGTSRFAKNLGASNDELHIVIIDEDGKFTGVPGSILEKYSFLSKALDCKSLDNEHIFYGNVLNNTSKYVWYFSPIKGSDDLDIGSYIATTTVTNGGTNYGKPIITYTDVGNGDTAGVGASAVATLNSSGVITNISIVNRGGGYSGNVSVSIVDSGQGATATAQSTGGIVTKVDAVNTGYDYYSANVTVTSTGQGATATAVLSPTGTIKTVSLNNGGSNYDVSDVLTVTGGTGTFIVDTVDVSGVILTGHLGSAGTGYTASGLGVSTTGGSGTNATVDIVVGKAISSITVNNGGTNYETVAVSISGTGTGAVANAVVGIGASEGIITNITVSNGGSGYTAVPTVNITPGGSGANIQAVISDVGSPNEGKIMSYVVLNGGTNYSSSPIVTVTPGGSGSTATATTVTEDTSITNWGQNCATNLGVPRTFYSLKIGSVDGAYSVSLGGGSNGGEASTADLFGGWDMFKNSEEVDVGLIFVGNGGSSSTNKILIQYVIDNIAEYRKDCMVFFSPNLTDVLNRDQLDAANKIKEFVSNQSTGINRDTSFAVCDSGWKLQYDVFNDKYRWIPLNPDIAGLCAQTETDYDAWWSPAGLTRGKIKNVVSLAFNPNKSSRDELYKFNVNSVVSFTGEGTVLYGDKTLQSKNSAFSYINVRRLFIVLERAISKAAKYQLFEFNDIFTRNQFIGMVEPYLRTVKSRRGIYDYKIICDESNNTPDIIDRAEFVASMFIKPARSINFITLNFVAVRTGVEFSEVVGIVQ